MTPEAIRHYLEASPFVGFRLITASGKKHYVPGPNYLHFSPSEKTANVYAKDGESFATVDVALITEILPDKRQAKRKKGEVEKVEFEAGPFGPTVEPSAMEEN